MEEEKGCDEINYFYNLQHPSNKVHCDSCEKDISKHSKILCADCQVDLCVTCFCD